MTVCVYVGSLLVGTFADLHTAKNTAEVYSRAYSGPAIMTVERPGVDLEYVAVDGRTN